MFTKAGWTKEQFDAVAPTFIADIMAGSSRPYTMM